MRSSPLIDGSLRRGIEDNLRSLGVERLAVVNRRLMRSSMPDAFFDDQLNAMAAARDLSSARCFAQRVSWSILSLMEVSDFFERKGRAVLPVLPRCGRR